MWVIEHLRKTTNTLFIQRCMFVKNNLLLYTGDMSSKEKKKFIQIKSIWYYNVYMHKFNVLMKQHQAYSKMRSACSEHHLAMYTKWKIKISFL